MIDKIRSKEREMQDAHDFTIGELYLQHCQQRYDGQDSPDDILRIFSIKEGNIAYDPDGTITLTNQNAYTTRLDPNKFDKGIHNRLKHFKIDLNSDYMGHFYHIPHGYDDIEELFGIDLSKHHLKGRSRLEENFDEEEDMAMYDANGQEILIG